MFSSYQNFIKKIGEGKPYQSANPEMIDKYKGVFTSPLDRNNIVKYIWENHGLSSFGNGLFWMVDPDDYNELATMFPEMTLDAKVFGRTATGCLFVMDKSDFGNEQVLYYLNVHTGEKLYMGKSFESLFSFRLCNKKEWMEDLYGDIEYPALDRYGSPQHDECIGFFPALALGGNEDIEKMRKVKIREYIVISAQLMS